MYINYKSQNVIYAANEQKAMRACNIKFSFSQGMDKSRHNGEDT